MEGVSTGRSDRHPPVLADSGLLAAASGKCWCMDPATVTPARALARLMVAAFCAVLLTLFLMVGAVGVADTADPSGAATASQAVTP